MKVGDLVKHKTCGVGVVLCTDITKNDGDYLVFFPTNRHRKIIKARRSWLEVVCESR